MRTDSGDREDGASKHGPGPGDGCHPGVGFPQFLPPKHAGGWEFLQPQQETPPRV